MTAVLLFTASVPLFSFPTSSASSLSLATTSKSSLIPSITPLVRRRPCFFSPTLLNGCTTTTVTPCCLHNNSSPSPSFSFSLPTNLKTLLLSSSVLLFSFSVYAPLLPVHAYGLENGRLEKCRGDAPCISTSSVGNPVKFGPPWSYQPETDDPVTAWASLKAAIEKNPDNGTIVESEDGPTLYYLRAEFPSALKKGTDDVEFRLIPKDALVTYRSASREAIFLYPIQTPVDTNKNKKRLESIRSTLGWEEFAGEQLYIDSKK